MVLGNLNTTKTWDQIEREVREELRKWGLTDYHLPFKGDSRRLGSVTLVIRRDAQDHPLTCGHFNSGNWLEKDYLAILGAIKSTRLAEQRGMGSLFAAAAQLISLPDPNDPRHILGVNPDATNAEIQRAYRRKVQQTHPDRGGSQEDLDRVIEAGRKLGVA